MASFDGFPTFVNGIFCGDRLIAETLLLLLFIMLCNELNVDESEA